MNRFKTVAMLFCLGLVASLMPSRANADEHDKKTIITFSEPFEVPGVDAQILPAGTYQFRLADSLSDRHIVQISNEEGTHVYTTILAINNYRLHQTDKTVITFAERPAGSPPAIRAWFFPGDSWGQEFVYPKHRAIALAKLTNEPVLAIPDEMIAAPVETLKVAPVAAVTPSGEEVSAAEVVQPAATPAPAAALPQTASQLPLLALIGLLSLGVGGTLLVLSKRSA
jgi:LPXTG-motif cell wall-anchored protein